MKLRVGTQDAGMRLDVWLNRQISDLSRSRIQSLIRSGHITSEGKRTSAHTLTRDGMAVNVDIPDPEPIELVPEEISLDVLYEDKDLIVVNKPAGLVVHPAAGHRRGTLVNALLYHCRDLEGVGGELRPGIVHRLDKDTSGVMVIAKNDRSMDRLSASFKNREVRKEYQAIVHGIPRDGQGVVETRIGRSRHDRKKMSASSPSGRNAVTRYSVIETFKDVALLEVHIETGRTHQIRVHMAHIGHYVVGDKQYGNSRKDRSLGFEVHRQMLHSHMLAFRHPSDDREVICRAPLPADMMELLVFLSCNR